MISVVIPAYNRADLLDKALESVKKQKNIRFEILVIDDNSDGDEIEKVVKKYNARYFKNEKNRGAQVARNIGVLKAKYDYIAFLDSDDLWISENKLLFQSNILTERQEISVVFTSLEYIDDMGNITSKPKNGPDIYYDCFTKTILKKDIIGTYSSVMVRKKDFLAAGMCNTKLPARQDWDLWIKLSLLGNAYKLGNSNTQYRIHENQISSAYNKKIDGFSQLMINHKKIFFSKNEEKSYYIHLFKIVLLSVLRKTTSDNYEKLIFENCRSVWIMKFMAIVLEKSLKIPFIGLRLRKALSSTYLFKGL